MDVYPDFILEVPYDWTTFHEVMDRVATEFPENWRRYHGVESRDPMLVGDSDARDLMNTASRLATAAEALSDRRLPEGPRQFPEELESQARERRRLREDVVEVFLEMAEEEPDPEKSAGLKDAVRKARGPDGLFPKEDEYRVFRTFLEIESFERYGSLPGELADRVITLLEYLVGTESNRARQYLERVSKCYVLGLGSELAVMSRSVLESALESLELEPLVEEVRSVRGAPHASLSDWIEAASKAGLLDDRAREAADLVRKAGNDAVHSAPGVEPDAEEVLENLVVVLEAMDQAGSG